MAQLTAYIEDLVNDIGPRPATSQAESNAAEHIANALEGAGLAVETEEFTATRNGGWVRALYYALGVAAAIIAIFSPGIWPVALILTVVSVALLILDILDRNPLFQAIGRGRSQNVVARYQPANATNSHRKVIIVAHYDSGRSMVQAAPFLVDRYLLVRRIIRLAVVAMPILVILAVIPFPDVLQMILRIIAFFAALLVFIAAGAEVVNLFMPYNQGANCNASGVAVLLGLAQRITGVQGASGSRPKKRRSENEGEPAQESRRRRVRQRASALPPEEVPVAEPQAAQAAPLTEPEPTAEPTPEPQATTPQADQPDQPDQPQVDPSGATAQFDTVPSVNQTNPYLSTASGGRVTARHSSADVNTALEQATEVRPQKKPDAEPEWYKRAREKAEQKAAGQAAGGSEDMSKYRSKFADVPMSGRDLHKDDSSKKLTPEEIIAAAVPAATSAAARPATDALKGRGVSEPTVARPTSDDSYGRGGGASDSDILAAGDVADAVKSKAAAQLVLNPSPSSSTLSSDTPAGRVVSEPEPSLPSDTHARRGTSEPTTAQTQESSLSSDTRGGRKTSEPEPIAESASEVAPTPSSALRNLELPILTANDSGKISVQQAGLETEPIGYDPFEPTSTSPVSRTGSFAPLGATGVMKPVGEELLQYSETTDDLYIDDADDSDMFGNEQESEVHHAPDLVDMPDSRVRSFFGTIGDRFSGRKKESLDTSPTDWLGVDEDFDARKEGSQIGSWDNFSDDDDTWSGGAYGGQSEAENIAALNELSRELIDREVWFVALGAQESKNAGLQALVREHHQDFKGAIIINVEAVGLGDLHYTIKEGTFRQANTDHRLQNIISSSARSLGIDIKPLLFKGYSTAATKALDLGVRAVSVIGLDGDLPQGWRWADDQAAAISEENLDAAVDLLLEVVKNS